MPNITIAMGAASPEMKAAVIEKTVETLMEVMGLPEESFSTTITELPLDNFGVGKKTVAALHA